MGPLRGRRTPGECLQSEKPERNNPEFPGIGEGISGMALAPNG
jgi:hypothetical protein